MSRTARWLTLISALVLGLSYFLPIWQLDIWAPQYPEGLGLTIWLSHMTGNLTQINLLNHYIGMKHITPSAIPELRVMPDAVLLLAGLGLIAAAINRRWSLVSWITILISAGVSGLYDFYAWGYDYGHNLDPNAAIKVPGMSYQPPLIGHKQLLNIDAYSYPAIGGVAIGIAVLIALCALFSPWLKKRTHPSLLMLLSLGVALPLLGGCHAPPQPLNIGVDHCQTCLMTISDSRFGGELITKKGRVYKFDSLDCLARFYFENTPSIRTALVSDFLNSGTLISVDQATFLSSDRLKAPMGPGVVASADHVGLRSLKEKLFRGELLDWPTVLKFLHSS